jgi:hypothetical protein
LFVFGELDYASIARSFKVSVMRWLNLCAFVMFMVVEIRATLWRAEFPLDVYRKKPALAVRTLHMALLSWLRGYARLRDRIKRTSPRFNAQWFNALLKRVFILFRNVVSLKAVRPPRKECIYNRGVHLRGPYEVDASSDCRR